MAKQKRKLTPAEKKAKARRKAEFMTIFLNGKQKRVRRPVLDETWEYMPPPTVDAEAEAEEDDSVPF